MISVILYGRNDNYGYNLHKRATLSLNCFAEVLSEKNDEIIFVDYNTPDDFPTFPEAVQDLLTPSCKQKLRIVRVRENIHTALYSKQTHLFTLEPIARNVAIRRMNKNNKWVLSTNTDMIFLPKGKNSLNEIFRNFENGNYSAPRLEIPETIWESFDRLNPREIIKDLQKYSKALHLHEVVSGDIWNLYDAPGDFQLFTREDALKIGGFDEDMMLGWHCDSNLNKRLMMLNGKTNDASNYLDGFHCDHTRQVTPMHKSGSKSNDLNKFVLELQAPEANRENPWGLLNYELENIKLNDLTKHRVISAFDKGLQNYPRRNTQSKLTDGSYEKNSFPEAHVAVFIADQLMAMKKDLVIGWLGTQGNFKASVQKILLINGIKPSFINLGSLKHKKECDVVIFRNKLSRDHNVRYNRALFFRLVNYIYSFPCNNKKIKFIFTDVCQTRYEHFVRSRFDCSRTPYSARILSGYKNKESVFSFNLKKVILFLLSRYTKTDIPVFLEGPAYIFFYGPIEVVRAWLLENRDKHKIIFSISRFLYFRLMTFGFFK